MPLCPLVIGCSRPRNGHEPGLGKSLIKGSSGELRAMRQQHSQQMGHEIFSGSQASLPSGITWVSSTVVWLVELVGGEKSVARVLKAPLVILMSKQFGNACVQSRRLFRVVCPTVGRA